MTAPIRWCWPQHKGGCYERCKQITIKSTIASALIDLASENKLDERYWNHLRVQRNILDFLYALWLDDNRTLVGEFSTILKDLVEYDFSIADEHMKERLNIA